MAAAGPVILLDNYDSFTYNLSQVFAAHASASRNINHRFHIDELDCALILQYLGDLGCEHVVIRNDEKTVEDIRELQPRGILISPGPGDQMQHHCSFGKMSMCRGHACMALLLADLITGGFLCPEKIMGVCVAWMIELLTVRCMGCSRH